MNAVAFLSDVGGLYTITLAISLYFLHQVRLCCTYYLIFNICFMEV